MLTAGPGCFLQARPLPQADTAPAVPSKTPVDIDLRRKICDPDRDQTMQPLPSGVAAGARVRVRKRLWHLDAVTPHEDCRELHLRNAEDGDSRVLLVPFDRPAAETHERPPRVLRLRAWLHRLRELADLERPANHLLTRNHTVPPAILPYQLVPALEVQAGRRRVLLADEVGLGKTVQAGWILANTMARELDARVLIAVPPGLRAQWKQELDRLFAIDVTIVDGRSLFRAVNDLPPGMNVWTPPGVYLLSIDFLKRPDVAASASAVLWDLLVVDEAHVAAEPTERYRALKTIARRSRVVTLITATPFSGDETSFASLMSLGETPCAEPTRMYRRSRKDVGDGRRRRHRFVPVRLTPSEERLQRMLQRYCREVWAGAPSADGRLAAVVLRKRALSSAGALGRSLRRRLRLLTTSQGGGVQLSLLATDIDSEDDEPSGVLAAAGLTDATRERVWLARLIEAANRAGDRNSKLDCLRRLLRRMKSEAVVVFTEFRDTLTDLADEFAASLRIHGGMSVAERADVQARFNAHGGLLFATDAAAYGLNLHGRCRIVINFELPWNPARLEQRIGRVDRIGQARAVHAMTLVARDTSEDLVVANVARRLWRVAASFGQADRLAALLDDARMAGMAVGDEPLCDLPSVVSPGAAQVPAAAIDESGRLRRASRAAAARAARVPKIDGLAVSSTYSTGMLPPGLIAVMSWTLREPSGRVVASRTLAFHAGGPQSRPRTAAMARQRALDFIASHANRLEELADGELRSCRAAAREAHRQASQSQIEREMSLAGHAQRRAELQPGLFDNRVVRAERAADAQLADLQDEAQRRMTRLRHASALEDRLEVSAVLIVWDRRR